jgi:hypothetical protein
MVGRWIPPRGGEVVGGRGACNGRLTCVRGHVLSSDVSG